MIVIRKQHAVFGDGTLQMCSPKNKSILAYIRENEQEQILVISNLSTEPQKVSLKEMCVDEFEFQDVLNLYQPVPVEDKTIELEGFGFRWLKVGSM